MGGLEYGVIMLRFALGSLAASLTMVQAGFKAFLAVGLGFSNPGSMYQVSVEWGEIKNQIASAKDSLNSTSVNKLNGKWAGDGKNAYDNAKNQFNGELSDAQDYVGFVSQSMMALAMAYFGFAVYAAAIGVFALGWAIAVGISAFTPAYPAVKGAAEAAMGFVSVTSTVAAKLLAGLTKTAGAVVASGMAVALAAQFQKPGGETGVEDFQQITLDWEPPALP